MKLIHPPYRCNGLHSHGIMRGGLFPAASLTEHVVIYVSGQDGVAEARHTFRSKGPILAFLWLVLACPVAFNPLSFKL